MIATATAEAVSLLGMNRRVQMRLSTRSAPDAGPGSCRVLPERVDHMADVVKAIEAEIRHAAREGKKLCVRLNGSSDIAWECIACRRSTKRNAKPHEGDIYPNVFAAFPEVQFVVL